MFALRATAIAAQLLCDELLIVYRREQVPKMIEDFASAGFTRRSLIASPDGIFQMVVLASYDRSPFTSAAQGYERIWGMGRLPESLASRLRALSLLDLEKVERFTPEDIEQVLKRESFHGCSLQILGEVNYARTISAAASLARDLHQRLISAKTPKSVAELYGAYKEVHGVGEIIASKLIKYTVREIGAAPVEPSSIPLDVVWPITGEYHNAQAVSVLNSRLGSDVVPLTMGLLLKCGDPFAIDALFYLHRYNYRRLEELADEVAASVGFSGKSTAPRQDSERTEIQKADKQRDMEKARRLMEVIREVCDDIKNVTAQELKGLSTPRRLQASADRLFGIMAGYAADGKVHEMYQYYSNCLKDPQGQELDWILDQIQRKSLKSEHERFMRIYNVP